MRKIISKIAGLMLGLSLAAGVGFAVGSKKSEPVHAAETVAYTLTPAATTNSGYDKSGSIEIGGVTWNVEGNGTLTPWRLGGKSISSTTRRVYSSGAVSSSDITKVVLTVGTANSVTVNSLKLYVGTSAGGSQTSTVTGTFKASSNITFERPSGADWSNKYFTFAFELTISSTSNKYVQFSGATFYEEFIGSTANVTYNKNNDAATGSTTDSTTYDIGDTVTVLTNNFSLTDYTFDHWNTSANDSGTSYNPNDTFNIDSDITLYAQWTKNVGSDVATSKSFDSTKEYLLKVDYSSSSLYLAGTTDGTIGSNAAWGICTSNESDALRFSLSGSTVTSGRAAVIAESTYNSQTVYVKGLETGSFHLSTSSTSIYLYGDGNVYASSSSSYYIQYNYNNGNGGMRWYNAPNADRPVAYFVEASGPAPVSHTITYMANGGQGSMSPTVGVSPSVASCTFTYDGYAFARWNTQADGEGDDYSVGTIVEDDITLYVIWQEYVAPIEGNVAMEGVTSYSSVTVNGHPALKCGAGSTAGQMKFTLANANITKIKFYVAGWKGDTSKLINLSADGCTVSESSITVTEDSVFTGSSTSFTLSADETTYRFTLVITNPTAGAEILLSAAQSNKNRFIVWGATDLFAESFADEFSSNLTCDASGEDGPSFTSGHDWTTMNSFYNGLDAEEQGKLHDATFTVTGSGTSTVVSATGETSQSVAEAIARYDYIIAKYGTSEYSNFIGRTVNKLAPARIVGESMSSSSSTIVIVVVALTSITSIGVLLVIKRKRSLIK